MNVNHVGMEMNDRPADSLTVLIGKVMIESDRELTYREAYDKAVKLKTEILAKREQEQLKAESQ